MKKIFFTLALIIIIFAPNVLADTFQCAYDGSNCKPAIATFCPGIGNDVLVSFCTPKNSLNCENTYDCAEVGGPTSTPGPGGPTSTPVPPSPTPAICANIGTSWGCTPATLLGSMNCNATDPGACNPDDFTTCTGTHPNIYDDYCGSGFFCCGPSLTVPGNWPDKGDGVSLWCDDQLGTVRTSFGCIKASQPKDFINQMVAFAIQVSGGFSLLSLIYGGFVYVTSFGDPNRTAYGRELIMNSFIYLTFISIAILLVNLIGVNILNLDILGLKINL